MGSDADVMQDYVEDYQLSDNEEYHDEPAQSNDVSEDGAARSDDEGDEKAPLSRDQHSKRRVMAAALQQGRGGVRRGSSQASAVHKRGKDGGQGRKRWNKAVGRNRRVT